MPVSIAEQRREAERPERERRTRELGTQIAGELGVEYEDIVDPRTGTIRNYDANELRLRGQERRVRQELEAELDRIRGGSAALRERSEEALTLGRRGIREGERIRLGQAESGLAGLGLSESGLSERVRRAERETTAFAEADLESRVRITEMDETFKAEQSAIERLFSAGQAELGFLRQARLIAIQADYARQLAEIEQGNAFFNAIGSAVSTIGGIALMTVNPFAGAAVAATGERVL